MSELVNFPTGELNDWLAVLKPYQRDAFNTLLTQKQMEPEDAAKFWLSSTGPNQIIGFGGTQGSKPFWDLFQTEFRSFLCDETAYVVEKNSLNSHGQITRELLLLVIGNALSMKLGIAATFLAPAIVTMLYIAGKMTIYAYCKT